jgi:hypothetical protein
MPFDAALPRVGVSVKECGSELSIDHYDVSRTSVFDAQPTVESEITFQPRLFDCLESDPPITHRLRS